MMKRTFSGRAAILERQDGVAMLTVLMLTIILTVIGIAAITTTTMDIKLAGGERLRESSTSAAESCMSSAVQVIQQTLANGAIPSALTVVGANPSITVIPLQSEIMGQSDGNTDSAAPGGTPNAVLTLAGYTVDMDIDRLYAKPKSGGSLQFAAGFEGTGAAASIEIFYRIECYAASGSGATATAGKVSGVYACVATGESCQRKI